MQQALNAIRHFSERDESDLMEEDEAWSILETGIEGFEEQFPEAIPDLEANEAWTVGEVRRRFQIVSDGIEMTVEELLESVIEDRTSSLEKHREKTRLLNTHLERISRERLLPSDDVVNKVTRYETHLHRQLVQTMHELEALQGRRQGAPSPLARLDVTTDGDSDGRQELLDASRR